MSDTFWISAEVRDRRRALTTIQRFRSLQCASANIDSVVLENINVIYGFLIFASITGISSFTILSARWVRNPRRRPRLYAAPARQGPGMVGGSVATSTPPVLRDFGCRDPTPRSETDRVTKLQQQTSQLCLIFRSGIMDYVLTIGIKPGY